MPFYLLILIFFNQFDTFNIFYLIWYYRLSWKWLKNVFLFQGWMGISLAVVQLRGSQRRRPDPAFARIRPPWTGWDHVLWPRGQFGASGLPGVLAGGQSGALIRDDGDSGQDPQVWDRGKPGRIARACRGGGQADVQERILCRAGVRPRTQGDQTGTSNLEQTIPESGFENILSMVLIN